MSRWVRNGGGNDHIRGTHSLLFSRLTSFSFSFSWLTGKCDPPYYIVAMNVVNFRDAAIKYFDRGIMTMPLARDRDGFAKRPIINEWSRIGLDRDVLMSMPWENAMGIGIILGAASGNLAAIDIDSVGLSDTLISMLRGHKPPYMVRTARNRSHLYVRERSPSKSRVQTVTWDDVSYSIELKAQGTQIAAPPTPGYMIAIRAEPMEVDSIAIAWSTISTFLVDRHPGRIHVQRDNDGGNFPTPWQGRVGRESRNKSLYVEAHRLREARVPYHDALEILMIRVERNYETGDFGQVEVERTVRSAYRNGIETDANPRRISDWFDAL